MLHVLNKGIIGFATCGSGGECRSYKNYNDQTVISNINSFYDNSAFNFNCTFNPFDRLMVALKENNKFYERLLASQIGNPKI